MAMLASSGVPAVPLGYCSRRTCSSAGHLAAHSCPCITAVPLCTAATSTCTGGPSGPALLASCWQGCNKGGLCCHNLLCTSVLLHCCMLLRSCPTMQSLQQSRCCAAAPLQRLLRCCAAALHFLLRCCCSALTAALLRCVLFRWRTWAHWRAICASPGCTLLARRGWSSTMVAAKRSGPASMVRPPGRV
jgi:hypothetical protein